MNYIDEKVEEFEKEYVDIQRNINGGIAYKEWSYKIDAEEALDWLRTTLTEVDRRAREDYQPINATRIQNIEGRAYATFEVPDAEETAFFIKTTLPT